MSHNGGKDPYNRTLRAAMTIAPPAVNECMISQANKTIGLEEIVCDGPDGPGVAVELMQAIQTQLPYKIFLQYVPGNDSWRDTLDSFDRNETDISLNFFTQNEDRSSMAEFTSPVIFVRMVFAHHSNLKGDQVKLNLFYAPFDYIVWASLFSSALIIALLFFIISRRHKVFCFPAGSRRITKTTTFRRSVWKMVMAFVEKGTDDYYNVHGAERPLTFAWAFFLLIMQSVYNSSLIYQFLTVPSPPFSSLDDLFYQLNSKKITFISDSLNSRFLSDVRSTNLPDYVNIKKFFETNPPKLYPSEEMWNLVANNEDIITDDNSFTVNIQIRRSACNISSTDNLLKSDLWYSFLLPKNSPYQRDMANAIMQARGLTSRVEEKYKRPKCPQDSLTSKNVKVENVAGICLVLAVGSIVGIVCLSVENIHYYMRYKFKFLSWGKQAHFNPPKPIVANKLGEKSIDINHSTDRRKSKRDKNVQQEMNNMNNNWERRRSSSYFNRPNRKLTLKVECTECGQIIYTYEPEQLRDLMNSRKIQSESMEVHHMPHNCQPRNGFVYTVEPPFIDNGTKYLDINKNGHANLNYTTSAPVTPRINGFLYQ